MRICVFCASSSKVAPAFFEAANLFAYAAAFAGHTIVCGGGAIGLMGQIAETTITNGGRVVGILPRFMQKVEWQHNGLHELVLTDTMAQRKELMIANADAVVALPGGCGTLDELLEVITLKRLGQFTKPIIIVNINGFYDHLLALFDKMVDERVMSNEHCQAWTVVNSVEAVLPAIEQAPLWSCDAIHSAVL